MNDETPLIRGFSGLFTNANTLSLTLEGEGYAPLVRCSNVDIDDKYRISTRFGYSPKLPADIGSVHSCFGDKSLDLIVFCEKNALSLYILSSETTLRIRNITPELPMRYEMDGGFIYYTNGIEQGKINITNQTNKPWEIETAYLGPKTSRIFSNPPIGTDICKYKGRMHIASGKAVFISEPFDSSRFVLDEGNLLLKSTVVAIESTDECLIIGNENAVICYSGATEESTSVTAHNYPMIKGTAQTIHPRDLELNGEGYGIIAMTTSGMIFISEDGKIEELSQERIDVPNVVDLYGSSLIKDGKYICQLHVKK